MRDLISCYFTPTVGTFSLRTDQWGNPTYKLLTGAVHISPSSKFKITKVEYFNVLGFMVYPRILSTYTP